MVRYIPDIRVGETLMILSLCKTSIWVIPKVMTLIISVCSLEDGLRSNSWHSVTYILKIFCREVFSSFSFFSRQQHSMTE